MQRGGVRAAKGRSEPAGPMQPSCRSYHVQSGQSDDRHHAVLSVFNLSLRSPKIVTSIMMSCQKNRPSKKATDNLPINYVQLCSIQN